MVPVVWAQAIGEYGVMAALSARVSQLYTQIELSLRTDTEMWALGIVVLVAGVWFLRRA